MSRGVSAVGGTKGIHHEDITLVRQPLGQISLVGFFAWEKANVLQQCQTLVSAAILDAVNQRHIGLQ